MKPILFLFFSGLVVLSSCKKEDAAAPETAGQATLSFTPKAGDAAFILNTDFKIGDITYNLTKLRYWISDVTLTDSKGASYKVPDSYYLMEETGPISIQDGKYTYPATSRRDITMKDIPVGDYKTIQFSIGVDADHNDNLSLQSGELSQMNGMTNISWMWHTSYIFSAIEGTVNNGTTNVAIKAETGLNANYKAVTLNLKESLHVGSSKAQRVALQLDVSKLFTGIDIIATPIIGASQATQMSQLATNYTMAISDASVNQ